MRKRLLNFSLVLVCLALPFALMFTACNKKEEPESPPPAPPTIMYVDDETTLASAISQVVEGGKVILNIDVTLDTQLNIDKEVIIDLNGKTINNISDIWNEDERYWSLISVQANGDLTIIGGNGRVETKLNDCYAFDVRDGGKLTIESGTFMGNVSTIYVFEGEAIINGGTFGIQQLSVYNDSRYLLNCWDENYENGTANIIVNGGCFRDFNPQDNLSEGSSTNLLGEDSTVESDPRGDFIAYLVERTSNAE